MALVKDGELRDDPFVDVSAQDEIPAEGPVIVGLEQWEAHRDRLVSREDPLGIRLKSDQSPEAIAGDIQRFAVVALEFPAFRDGRAYSYARLVRERYGYAGELRAVGDVLMEQLHFMVRTGFNAFEIADDDPLEAFETAMRDCSVWYQPTGDGRETALQRRHSKRP